MKDKLFPYVFPVLFLTSSVLSIGQSLAQPAPVFQPIMEELETRLPSNLQMRLPAMIPTSDRKTNLYSFLPDDDSQLTLELDNLEMEFFTVLIGNTPDCSEQKNLQDCFVAAVGVTKDPIKSQAELDTLLSNSDEKNITTVQLKGKIPGYYFNEEKLQLIVWRQKEMAHLLLSLECDRQNDDVTSEDCISKRQLIDMAESAIEEPVVINRDTSYYQF